MWGYPVLLLCFSVLVLLLLSHCFSAFLAFPAFLCLCCFALLLCQSSFFLAFAAFGAFFLAWLFFPAVSPGWLFSFFSPFLSAAKVKVPKERGHSNIAHLL